jgi:hypothetical protein
MFACLPEGGGTITSGADAGEVNTNCSEGNKDTYYPDIDGDGYGDALAPKDACELPEGYSTNGDDCDDNQPNAYPGAVEVCGDKIDNDCSGSDPCLPNLTAQWSFDDLAGVNSSDGSGTGHIGILQGGLANIGTSMLVFDGVDDYVEVPHAPAFELVAGTVAFWFMPTQVGIEQSMVSKDSSGNDQGGHLSFYHQADGTVRVRLQSNNETYEIISNTPLLPNNWAHVAFMFGGNEGMTLMVNGVVAGVDLYTGGMQRNLEPLVIGAGTGNSGDLVAEPISQPFAGSISDVQMYDRQLYLEEILDLAAVTAPLGGGTL